LKIRSKKHFDGNHRPLVTVMYDGGVGSSCMKKGLEGSGMECAHSIVRMDVRHCLHIVQLFFF
jgi:hypothetical protein